MVTTVTTPETRSVNPSGLTIEERLAVLAARKEELRHNLRTADDADFDKLNLEYGAVSSAYSTTLREYNEDRIVAVRMELFDTIREMVDASQLSALTQETVLQIVYQIFPGRIETVTEKDGNGNDVQREVEYPETRDLIINGGYVPSSRTRRGTSPTTGTSPLQQVRRTPSTGGWSHPQHGSNLSLDAAFQAAASAAEKAEHDGINSGDAKKDNSRKWAFKTKVTRAAGFAKAE